MPLPLPLHFARAFIKFWVAGIFGGEQVDDVDKGN